MNKVRFWSYKADYFPEILPIIWENPLHGLWKLLYFWIPMSIEVIPEQVMSFKCLVYPETAFKDRMHVIFKCITYPVTFIIVYHYRAFLPLFVCLMITHILGSVEMALFDGFLFAFFSVTHISLFGRYDDWGKDFFARTLREGAEELRNSLLEMPAEYFYTAKDIFEGLPSDIAKDTYRKLMRKFHPDVTGGDKLAAQNIAVEYKKHCVHLGGDGRWFDDIAGQ